jgi:hypothetical protein
MAEVDAIGLAVIDEASDSDRGVIRGGIAIAYACMLSVLAVDGTN